MTLETTDNEKMDKFLLDDDDDDDSEDISDTNSSLYKNKKRSFSDNLKNSSNAKRRKINFQNTDGVDLIIGPGILEDGNLNTDNELLNEFMSEYDIQEQNQIELRNQETMERGVKAISQLRNSEKNKEQLSKGQKKLKQILLGKNYTHDDLSEKIDIDDEGLLFIPVVPPQMAFVNSLLGPELKEEHCFGCNTGLNVASVSHGKIEDLRQLIIDLYGRSPSWKVALLVSEYYRTEIMKPSNKDIRDGEIPLKEWSPRSVYDHITTHMYDPSFVLSGILSSLREHEMIIKCSSLYKIRSEQIQTRRPIDLQDIYVSKTGHKMLLDTYSMMIRIMNSKPERMLFGNNTTMDLTKEPPGIVRKKANIKNQNLNIRSILQDFA